LLGCAQGKAVAKKDIPLERVGDVLGNSLKRLDLRSKLDDYGVWPIWNEVVGRTIALNAQPEKIRNGTLFVKVTSPVWMQQLQFMKQMIADKLNDKLKADIVKNIFFIVGRIDISAVPTQDSLPNQNPVARASKIDEEFLESVRDPEIRNAFKKLLTSYSRRQQKTE
jgi:hypothetical protein